MSAKLEAIGEKEAGFLTCFAKVAGRGRATSLGRCVQRAEGRFTKAFDRAGECSGEDGICGCLAENCAIAVRLSLPDLGPSRCESARLRAAAAKVIGTLRCNARAVKKGLAVDPTCVQRVQTKYRAAFARTIGCTGDTTAVGSVVQGRCVMEIGADPTGGSVVAALCTSHACDGVD